MIIYNTTFHVEDKLVNEYLQYIKQVYLPEAMQQGFLMHPRFCKVLTTQEGQEGSCFSLQFSVKDMDTFNDWFEKTGCFLQKRLLAHFRNGVLCFSTFLDEMTLES